MNKPPKIKEKNIQKIIKLQNNKQFVKAKKEALLLLEIQKDNIKILRLLAIISSELDELDNEKKYLLKLLSLNSSNSDIYNDLGNFYKKNHDYTQAKEMYIKAIKLDPNNSLFYGNLALLYNDLKEYVKAEETYQIGMKLNPDNKTFLVNYAMFLLKKQDYIKGFDFFRYRYDEKKDDRQTNLLTPDGLLQKKMDIKGKVIYITDEQGAGDIVQFMRYIPIFEAHGAKVHFNPRKLLHRLFQVNFPQVVFIQGQINIDFHIPLVDSAYYFETQYETIPYQESYLHVNKNDSNIINNKYFKNETKKKIGIVWRSNIGKNESSSKQKERESRNCTLDDFLTYFNTSDVQLYSLQVAVTNEERILLKENNIQSLGDNLVDFYDNALIIDNLDLVIGIDTISMLITGAMGKNGIVLLSYNSDWRWGRDSDTTNWFKSLKLVRQTSKNNWIDVLDKVSRMDNIISEINPVISIMKVAIELHQNGNFDEAKKIYNRVLELEPNNADAYHYLGVIAFQNSNPISAIALMYQAVQLKPNLMEAHENLQKILLSSKSAFIQKYLKFKLSEFNINQFSVQSLEHKLTNDETILLYSMRLTVELSKLDKFIKSIIILYIDLLENNFLVGLDVYLNKNDNIELQIKKIDLLHQIIILPNFNIFKNELEVISKFFNTMLSVDTFDKLMIKDATSLTSSFLKFYKSFPNSFSEVYINNLIPILKKYIKYNYNASFVFEKKIDKNIKNFFYITSICNPIFLDPICKSSLFKEIQDLYKKSIILKKKNINKINYMDKNLLMHWYTTLRDAIDDSFIDSKYVLLINDTTDHYHPGCFMTSMGMKEMLSLRYDNIIDIPIHEIYTYGKYFNLASADKYDDQNNYRVLKEKLPIINLKLENAQEIVINGEGTLHNAAPHVTFLLYLAYIAKTKYNKKVSIVNHSPYPSYTLNNRNLITDNIYKKVYNTLDFVGIRESYSKSIMDNINVKSELTFDCSSIYLESVNHSKLKNVTIYDEYVLLSSSVVIDNNAIDIFKKLIDKFIQDGKNIILFSGGPYEEKLFLNNLYQNFKEEKKVSFLETKNVDYFLSVIKYATILISGRFHYSIVAMYLKCPFILLASNTSKNIGLLNMAMLPNKIVDYKSKSVFEELVEEYERVLLNKNNYILSDEHLNNLTFMAKTNFIKN